MHTSTSSSSPFFHFLHNISGAHTFLYLINNGWCQVIDIYYINEAIEIHQPLKMYAVTIILGIYLFPNSHLS